jgi:hypothetical protein
MEQLKAADVAPMLVPSSKVRHLGSKTLKMTDDITDLTHEQVRKYNKKFGKELFGMI